MGVTGVIYPAYLPPYSTVFWHLLAVARSGSNRADDDDVAWESARRRKKKPKWTTLLIIDFGCSQEYLQCGRGHPLGSVITSVPMASNGTWQ